MPADPRDAEIATLKLEQQRLLARIGSWEARWEKEALEGRAWQIIVAALLRTHTQNDMATLSSVVCDRVVGCDVERIPDRERGEILVRIIQPGEEGPPPVPHEPGAALGPKESRPPAPCGTVWPDDGSKKP